MSRYGTLFSALMGIGLAMCAPLLSPVIAIVAPTLEYLAPALAAIAVTVAAVIVAFGILRFAQVIRQTNVLAKVRLLAFQDELRASAIG